MNQQGIQNFTRLCGLIKNVKRSGWLRHLPADKVESVADHSSRIAMLTMALRGIEHIDQRKCLQMALIHDIGEGIIGDITPLDKVNQQQKFKREHAAVKSIFEQLGEESSAYYLKLWLEYEEASTYEARTVKDLDKYEMMQQAFEYEQRHGVDLSEFYSCIATIQTKEIQMWVSQLVQDRNTYLQANKK